MKHLAHIAMCLAIISQHVHAQNSPLSRAPASYTRLIDATPTVPSVRPSSSLGVVGTFLELALPKLVDELRSQAIGLEFAKRAEDGLRKAIAEGGSGVLLRVTKVEVWYGTVRTESIWGTGVESFGTGRSATDACVNSRCWERVDALPRDYAFTADSMFYWVSLKADQPGEKYVNLEGFASGNGGIEDAARLIVTNSKLQDIQRRATWARKVEAYAANIKANAAREEDRQNVTLILENRKNALQAIESIERNLAIERDRAKRAADARKIYDTLSTIMSLGANLAIVSGVIGDKVVASTPAGVSDALRAAEDKSSTKIRALEQSLRSFSAEVEKGEAAIYSLNVTIINAKPGDNPIPPVPRLP